MQNLWSKMTRGAAQATSCTSSEEELEFYTSRKLN